jgi:hypothetical protein
MSKHGNREKKIIALAYFHRYGWIALLFACVAIYPKTIFLTWSFGFIAYAIWSYVGYKLRWKHIFCSYQNAYRLSMTPDNIRWGWVKKSDAYGVTIIFFVIGVACLCLYIANLYA